MRGKISFLLTAVITFGLSVPVVAAEQDITILYTNDIHTNINKELTYSKIAGYERTFENVLLVDAGDHIQGTAYGGMDNGATITELMNATGYDAAALGNHEFDYGMDGCLSAIDRADFSYLSCNFHHVNNGKVSGNVLDSYKIFDMDGVKVAFVGVMTPETMTSAAPVYFQNENGEFIYGFAGGTDGSELYAAVQKAVDAASKEADYIIGLGHLGTDLSSTNWTSEKVIANTTGLDAFIDGHSHTAISMAEIADKNGNAVILTQTGSAMETLGQMTISADGKIEAKLLTAEELTDIIPDKAVKQIEENWLAEVDGMLGEKIADSTIEFTINDAEGNRAVRKDNTNLTDFNADAYYWYLNEVEGMDCDVALINGGGVRASVPAGDWTYNSCKAVNPFGNMLCLVEITGQDLLDALEFGARNVGIEESGGLLHCAGLTYDLNTAVENTVQVNENHIWVGGPDKYRVRNVQVYDRESHSYQPLMLDKTYRLAGAEYTLLDCGDGFGMMDGAMLVKSYICEDYLTLAAYARAFKDIDNDGYAELTSAGSPLAVYENYLIDYENIAGSKQLNVLEETEGNKENGDIISVDKERMKYRVIRGDSLWRIARKQYDDGSRWSIIFNANRDIIHTPDRIFVGQELDIPVLR